MRTGDGFAPSSVLHPFAGGSLCLTLVETYNVFSEDGWTSFHIAVGKWWVGVCGWVCVCVKERRER